MTKLKLAAGQKQLASAQEFQFPTLICRKISTKEDEEKGLQRYVGQADASAFLNLPEDENVRTYLLDAANAKRSGVHMVIEETLRNRPEIFSVLNGGVCIVADDAILQEDQRIIRLIKPSIINGSQTRGVIRDYINSLDDGASLAAKVKFELIVTKDQDLVADISIARNFQVTVKPVSILGKKGFFEEIEKNFSDYSGKNRQLRTSETDRGEEFVQTEKLIQVITALIPPALWEITNKGGEHWNKAFAYSSAAGPLRLFEDVYKRAKGDKDNPPSQEAIKLYNFYVQIASQAWELYETWSQHQGFSGTGLKKGITRDKNNPTVIKNVVDGIIFPIIAAYAAFAKFENDTWKIAPPSNLWRDQEIVNAAKGQFMTAAGSNPNLMGKEKSIYQSLYIYTEMFARISQSI